MKLNSLADRPSLLFLPFLFFYFVFIYFTSSSGLHGDEARHISYVENLSNGYYSPPAPCVELEVGPGYPLFLLPFYGLKAPFLLMRMLNGLLLYFSIVLLYKTLRRNVRLRIALLASFFWAFYFNAVDYIGLLYSESLGIFLLAAFVYLLSKAFQSKSVTDAYLSGLTLAALILTKVVFGYVLLMMLGGMSFMWLFHRGNSLYRLGLKVLAIAFIAVSPYLAYTYSLTGRLFYWSTAGGINLYPMATPYADEYGSYLPAPTSPDDEVVRLLEKSGRTKASGGNLNLINRTVYVKGYMDSINAHHGDNYREFNRFNGVQRDDAFKQKAMELIRKHPVKFIQNCISNTGRIFFNFPYSYSAQKPSTLVRLPLSGAILLMMLLAVYPTLRNWRNLAFPVRFLLLFGSVYLGGSVLGSAETRMFTLILPVFILWVAVVLDRTVKIDFGRWKD